MVAWQRALTEYQFFIQQQVVPRIVLGRQQKVVQAERSLLQLFVQLDHLVPHRLCQHCCDFSVIAPVDDHMLLCLVAQGFA